MFCSYPQVCGVSNGTCASRRAGPVQAIDRRERLRRLALETIDLSKDPYFMRNHLGQYECRLCLTLHNNEGNYLAHTQARRPVFADRPFCLVAAQHCRASAWRTPRRAGLFSPTALLACWLRSTAGHQRRARLRARHASCSLAAQQRRALATWLGATALGGARCMNKVFTLRQRFLRQPGGAQGKRHQQNLAKCAA